MPNGQRHLQYRRPSIATNAFFFVILELSLTAAVFATLVRECVRRCLLLTQPRHCPHKRARIRAWMMQEGWLVELQRTAHFLHTFLRLSIAPWWLGSLLYSTE